MSQKRLKLTYTFITKTQNIHFKLSHVNRSKSTEEYYWLKLVQQKYPLQNEKT